MKTFYVLGLLSAMLLIGCGEHKVEPVKVGEMSDYRDPAYGFKIHYPKEWKMLGTTGKAVFAKSQAVLDRFIDPRSGEPGAQVTVEVVQFAGRTMEEIIQQAKDDMKQLNYQVDPDGPNKLSGDVAGKKAVWVTYLIKATTKNNIVGHQIFVLGDTSLYRLDFEGYGDQYEAHLGVFDAMLKSFELPVFVVKKADVWSASGNLETYTGGAFFTMAYPDNLEFVQVPKGNNDFAMEMRADRRDCSIHIDVFGAKGLTVDKVWEQNKGRYKAKGTGNTTIDGNKAFWVDYAPMANVSSRAYFVVKNDKVIRATVNYFAPQKEIYFTVFEKCVSSIKLK